MAPLTTESIRQLLKDELAPIKSKLCEFDTALLGDRQGNKLGLLARVLRMEQVLKFVWGAIGALTLLMAGRAVDYFFFS